MSGKLQLLKTDFVNNRANYNGNNKLQFLYISLRKLTFKIMPYITCRVDIIVMKKEKVDKIKCSFAE